MRTIALFVIDIYKRFLSPHKGFRCAYASLHGGASCSSQIRGIIVEKGFVRGWTEISDQFSLCKSAAAVLMAESDDSDSQDKDKEKEQKKPKPKTESKCWLLADLPCMPCGGFGGGSKVPDCDVPDCSCL